jgi:hypothetical protein
MRLSKKDYRALARQRDIHWTGKDLPRNNNTTTQWKCTKHKPAHVWPTTYGAIQKGTGCPVCAGLAPKTEADYHALASQREFLWTGGTFPANVGTDTEWTCEKHTPAHVWTARYTSIQQGSGCPQCAALTRFGRSTRRKEPKDYEALATLHGFNWTGPEVANTSLKTGWRCAYGHTWSTAYKNIHEGCGCPFCAGCAPKTEKDYKDLARLNGIVWAGPTVPKNIFVPTNWRCNRHRPAHVWPARYNNIQQGGGCPMCAEVAPKTEADYHSAAAQRQIFWAGTDLPENAHSPTQWRCEQHDPHHTWTTSYHAIRQKSGCPLCANARRGRGKRMQVKP